MPHNATSALTLAELLFQPDRERRFVELLDGPPVRRARYFDGTDVWLVTRREEITTVLTDPRFSNDITKQSALDLAAAAGLPKDVADYFTRTLGTSDPPDHTRLRRLVTREFTARRVSRLRPRIQELTDELLAEVREREEVDLIDSFARPLPLNVICELLGAPTADRALLHDALSAMTSADSERIASAARTLVGYLRDLANEKRRAPRQDLLSALSEARDSEDGRLSTEELTSVSLSLLLGGRDTTVSLIGNGAILLLTHPDQLLWLRNNIDLMSRAVEEVLRWAGPADVGVMRSTLEEVELGGVTLGAGEPVEVVYASANRDPRHFTDAQRFDLDRGDRSHLAFGHGLHHCVGAALGRAEAEIALRGLITRFPDLSLAIDRDQVTYQPGLLRALRRLPVRPGRWVPPEPTG